MGSSEERDKELKMAEQEEVRNIKNNCQFIRQFLSNIRENGEGLGSESVSALEGLRGDLREFVGSKVEIKSEKENRIKFKGEESPERGYKKKRSKSSKEKAKESLKRERMELTSESSVTSSDTETESDCVGSAEDSSDSEDSGRRKSRQRERDQRMRRQRRRNRSPTEMMRNIDLRKLPKLEKYNEETGRDLLKYLDKFELYCRENFRGHKDFWISELEEHLEGKTLEHFKMLRDWDDSYKSVKKRLVKWYTKDAKLRKKTYKKKFEKAKPRDGENIHMFSIRLASLYKSAFPGGSYDKSDVLMDRFRKVIPKRYQRVINTQMMAYGLRKKKVTFTFMQNCVKLQDVDNLDTMSSDDSTDKKVKEVEIYLGRDGRKGNRQYQDRYKGTREVRGWRNTENRNIGSGSYVQERKANDRVGEDRKSPEQEEGCLTCRRTNHLTSECRLNLGLCLLCGEQGHFVGGCPKRRQQDDRGRPNDRETTYGRSYNRGKSYDGRGNGRNGNNDYSRSYSQDRKMYNEGNKGAIQKQRNGDGERNFAKQDGMNEYYDQYMARPYNENAGKEDSSVQELLGRLDKNNPVERNGGLN